MTSKSDAGRSPRVWLRFGLVAAVLLGAVAAPDRPARAEPTDKTLYVYKTPWCGCCTQWAEAMEQAGYTVEITELEDLSLVRRQAGVPDAVQACHTGAIGGYVIEGHVPPEAVAKLLEERPDVRGIAVPGMPMGSVGMGSDPQARYDVLTFGAEPSAVFFEAGR